MKNNFFKNLKKMTLLGLGLTMLSLGYAEAYSKVFPLLKINTNGRPFERHSKINAHLWGGNEIAKTSYQNIEIRRRGQSSDKFAKKQYQFNFIDEIGENKKKGIFGLPKGKSWILHAPYVDRSYIRNVLAYSLDKKIAHSRGGKYWSVSTKYVELEINGGYRGIYILMEKIEKSSKRLDLKDFKRENVDEEPSFILQVQANGGDFKTKKKTKVKWVYPSGKKIKKWKKEDPVLGSKIENKIKAHVDAFEAALKSRHFKDPNRGYRKFIDVDSFVDYMIVTETYRNVDGYRRSLHFFKDRNGKINLGPIWDFNLALGNLSFYRQSKFNGWNYRKLFYIDGNQDAFWFKRLMKDPYFVGKFYRRYKELRRPGNPLSDHVIKGTINKIYLEIDPQAVKRDQEKWKGTYKFVEKVIFDVRLTKRKKGLENNIRLVWEFLKGRTQWMDKAIEKLYKRRGR